MRAREITDAIVGDMRIERIFLPERILLKAINDARRKLATDTWCHLETWDKTTVAEAPSERSFKIPA